MREWGHCPQGLSLYFSFSLYFSLSLSLRSLSALSLLLLCSPNILSSFTLFPFFFLNGQKTGMTLVHYVFDIHAWRQCSDAPKSRCAKCHVYIVDPPLDHGDAIHPLFELAQTAYEDKSLTGPKIWTGLGSCYKWTTGKRSAAILKEPHNTPKTGLDFFFLFPTVHSNFLYFVFFFSQLSPIILHSMWNAIILNS